MDWLVSAWPFELALAAMLVLALGCVVPALLRGKATEGAADAQALHVRAAQVSALELARARSNGEWSAATYEEARAELEREVVRGTPAPRAASERAASRAVGLGVCVGLPIAALALYLALGDPSALQREGTMLSRQATAPSSAALATYVRDHPKDGRAWVLLARTQASAERFADAAASYARAVTFAKVAQDPAVWCEYADALGMAQGGSLAGPPQLLIEEALRRDPMHPQALELAGSAAYERAAFGEAAKHWRTLLARLPEASVEQRTELSAAIARAERRAATSLPAGPSMATASGVRP